MIILRREALIGGTVLGLMVYALFVVLGLGLALTGEGSLIYLAPYFKYSVMGSILCGGFLAGYFNKKRGWASGGLAGLCMTVGLLLVSMLFLPGAPALGELASSFFTGALLGGMAGVCGVNISRAQRKKQRKRVYPPKLPLS